MEPRTLGPRGPKSGQPRAGFVADVIAVSEDPPKRIQVLGETERVFKVRKDDSRVVDRSVKS